MVAGEGQGPGVSMILLLMSVWCGTLRFSFSICKDEDMTSSSTRSLRLERCDEVPC